MKAKLIVLLMVVASAPTLAVPPTIHVTWDETPAPESPDDYEITTTDADFPDVELRTGSLTWRIWSTDTDNAGGVGDIGVISSPHPQNFAVAILDPSDGAGARDVTAIRLAPSSAGNYSNVTGHPVVGSVISGTLMDELVVQADGSGTGGEVALSIGSGPVTANMTIHKLNYFGTSGVVSGTIDVDVLAGLATFSIFTGTLNIGATTGDGAIVRIFDPTPGAVTISEMGSGFRAFIAGGVAQSGVLTFGDFVGLAVVEIGQGIAGGSEVAGHLHFLDGIPQGVDVTVASELTSTGVIELFAQPMLGILKVDGGSGTVWGGSVNGLVAFGFETGNDTGFAGAAQFTTLKAGGTIAIAGDLDGSVLLTETNAGELTVSGDLSASGEIEVYESLIGSISVLGDAVGEITFGDGGAGSVSVDGHISGPLLIEGSTQVNITADADTDGVGDITGDVLCLGAFDGGICGANIPPGGPLPANISLAPGPNATICGEPSCLCNAPGCGTVDCNSNQTRDECDIAEGTSQDCNVNMLPDECEPGSPFPAGLISCGPMFGQSLWRTQNNVMRLTFACDITGPGSGDVLVQELLSSGAFGSDLSGDFTFTVEETASGKPRILKINAEPDATLSHQIWYGVRNTGAWGAAGPFEVHYVNLIGDATNDNLVQYSDLSLINSEVRASPVATNGKTSTAIATCSAATS